MVKRLRTNDYRSYLPGHSLAILLHPLHVVTHPLGCYQYALCDHLLRVCAIWKGGNWWWWQCNGDRMTSCRRVSTKHSLSAFKMFPLRRMWRCVDVRNRNAWKKIAISAVIELLLVFLLLDCMLTVVISLSKCRYILSHIIRICRYIQFKFGNTRLLNASSQFHV